MTVTVSATEARVRFGAIMRRAAAGREPIVVERAGEPAVVILSMEEYRRLLGAASGEDWQPALERALRTGQLLRARRDGAAITAPEDLLVRLRLLDTG